MRNASNVFALWLYLSRRTQIFILGMACVSLVAIDLTAQTDTVLVDSRGDTLLVRKTLSAWRFGITGSAATGINTGALWLSALVNNDAIRAGFTGQGFGKASAWALGAEASWQPEQGLARYGGHIGFVQQTGEFAYSPESGYYGVLQSSIRLNAVTTGLFATIPVLPRCVAFGGAGALWSLGAESQTTYLSAPRLAVADLTPAVALPIQTPALSLNAGIAYVLHKREIGNANLYTTPFLEAVWQPLLSGANASSWGALMLRLGISCAIEPLRADTLSVQPLIRWLPIVQLAETPLASMISEEQVVTGRIATARENRDAVLEERIVIYRPDEKALLYGIPPEALEILRIAVPLLLSRAHCRLVLTVPAASSGNMNTPRAEATLGLLVDYLLRRGVEEASIEAGIGENRFLQGEALQLRIRIARGDRR